ncbi:TPA: hypothetical protein N2909_004436 [Vibrio parahaemolyticus]|nr:hypothetical protein [Vibrio parahaemolyticus]
MFGKVWKDPVFSTVLGGLIISVITALSTYFLGYWSDTKKLLADSYLYLLSPSNVPVWWVVITSIVTALVVLLILIRLLIGRKVEVESNSWDNYREDVFWGVEWHWSYWGGHIQNLRSLCPKCKYEMAAERYFGYRTVTYECDDCGYAANLKGESEYDIEHKVRLKVQQKLRTGEWVKDS